MKLFLASALDKTISFLPEKLGRPTQGARVLFVANAADNNTNTWWVELDRKAFTKLGCDIQEFDLRQKSASELNEALKDVDILHIAGGSVLYLIALLKSKGFDEVIIKNLQAEEVVYTGTSAGSMIVSKDLSLLKYDEEEAEYAKDMTDLTGLGLVPFLIIPHTNNPDFIETNKKIAEHLPKESQSLITLNDKQAVWVENNKLEILFSRNK